MTVEPKKVRWDDLPKERMAEGLARRYVHGEKAMVAQIFLAKGVYIQRHVHPNEQITYVIEGALRLRLGDDGAQVFDVRTGEILVIPENLPHSAEALEDTLDIDVFAPPRQDWLSGDDAYMRK